MEHQSTENRLSSLDTHIKTVEDFRVVGTVKHFEQAGLHEIKPTRPEQKHEILTLMIVPVTEHVGLSFLSRTLLLILPNYRLHHTLLLLKLLLLSPLKVKRNVDLSIVVLE